MNVITAKEKFMSNTKARHEEIYTSTLEVIEEAGGIETIDALSQEARLPQLRKMYRQIIEMTDCHINTAKRNLTTALRQSRHTETEVKATWGGPDRGGGRPPKNSTGKD